MAGRGAASGDRSAGGRDAPYREERWPRAAPDGRGAGPDAGAPASGDEEAAEKEPTDAGDAVLDDVAGLVAQRDEYLGALQRLQADFENYRKRVQRQQEEQSVRAAVDLVTKVLPVLDTLDLARAHLGGAEGASDEARALDQARAQLIDVLAKEGLERVDSAGVDFDPVVHDAVAHADPEQAEIEGAADAPGAADDAGTGGSGVRVDEVLRAGYRWRGQVLRPAMVRVRG